MGDSHEAFRVTARSPDQFTQELRITSPAGGAFDFVTGLYYIDQFTRGHDRAFPGTRFGPAQGEFTQGRDVDVEGLSAFVHGNYHFSEALTLFAGLRYLTETKKSVSHALTCPTNPITCRAFRLPTRTEPLAAPVDLETDEPTGSIGLRYNVNDNVMVYGSVARGVQSAAVNNSRDGGMLTSRLGMQYIDERYRRGTVANNLEELIPNQTLVNGRIAFRPRSGGWGVAAWVKNATDDDTRVHATFAAGGLGGRGALGRFQEPRTYGMTLDYRF